MRARADPAQSASRLASAVPEPIEEPAAAARCPDLRVYATLRGHVCVGPERAPRATHVPRLATNQIDGEIVIMSIEQEKYYGLDPIGSRIWELIAQPRSVADLCEMLLAEFDIDRETCQRDVLAFLERLQTEKVIQIAPPMSK
jgi:hypothetical protein